MSEPAPERANALVTADRLTEAMDRTTATVRALIQTVAEESEARDAENVRYGRRNRHLIWALAVSVAFDIGLSVIGGVFALVLLGLVHHEAATTAQLRANTAALRAQVLSSCSQDRDIGGLPVSVNPATGKASPLGVRIISDERGQWFRLGCPGTLPPPDPAFVHWAGIFHIPVYPPPPASPLIRPAHSRAWPG